jgi:hypothetical protein
VKFISLFAGIGGLDLGLERAGMECVAQVEINEFALSILNKHWSSVFLNSRMCVMSEKKISQQQTLFAEGSLVKMSRLRGKGKGLKAKGQRYGQSSIVSFAKFAQDGSLLKTSQGYSQVTMDGSLQKFYKNFPQAGMMRNGVLYRVPMLERHTSESHSPYSPATANRLLNGVKERKSGAKIGSSLKWHPDFMQFYATGQRNFVNPLLCEWMMGFPILWSDCEQQGTQSLPTSQSS